MKPTLLSDANDPAIDNSGDSIKPDAMSDDARQIDSAPLPFDELQILTEKIKSWSKTLGFADVGISNTDLSAYEPGYFKWIEQNFHGEMAYMSQHGTKRTRPQELEPGTLSIISCRMNYYDAAAFNAVEQLQNQSKAYISRYALNKDYHKLIRKRLQALAEKIQNWLQQTHPNLNFRCFTDSAPVLERAIAEKAGLGFTGKNSLIIHPKAGSFFFLGEIYLNLPLPFNQSLHKSGCGPCTACIQECPTQAILADGVIDAKRCISYLTIEYKGVIEESLRPLMGNRIYGCDDCQLVCPWNKFTESTQEANFKASPHALDQASLIDLLNWQEADFLKKLEGSPIRRIGYAQWCRNLCIALGNTTKPDLIPKALNALKTFTTDNELVKHHQDWAIRQLVEKIATQLESQEDKLPLNPSKNPAEKPTSLKITRPGHFHTPKQPAVARKYYLPDNIELKKPKKKSDFKQV